MRFSKAVSTGLAFSFSLTTAAAQAQNNAPISVTATVQTPITVTAAANLDLGSVFPGVAKSVATNGASAGRWTVAGQASSPVNLSFTTSNGSYAVLNGPSSATLPIAYTGEVTTSAGSPTGTGFAITTSGLQASTLDGTGGVKVFLGASVTPAVSQAAGSYSGTVTLTVTY